jgi:membrane-anchored protein YejM (alkaline phosphatase superfamily)
MTSPVHPAPVRRRAVFYLWLANLALGALVGLNYLAHVPEARGLKVWLFALPALISSILTLTILPAAMFTLAAQCLRSTQMLGTLQAAFWTLFQILLFADTRIYNIFRYHFNGQVLNLVYTRGSEDAIQLGWQVWTAIVLGLTAFITLQTFLWKRALKSAHAAHAEARRVLLRPALVWGCLLLPSLFLEKTIYASARFGRDREITRLARLFPLYTPVPMEDLAERVLGTEREVPAPPTLDGVALSYPKEAPRLPPTSPRFNVLVLVIDCLRRDMLAPATTPNLARWAATGCRRFENHVSGGNSTRYGLFSLLYGLHGSYWFPFLAQRRGPVLVDALSEAGYEFGIFGSASMNYPELRATTWAAIAEAVHDEFPSPEAWRRDELAGQGLSSWLAERAGNPAPFFAFLLLDSPHQTYSHPPGRAPFEPSAPDLDYMVMTRNEGPPPEVLEAVRNRYKNAVHHADAVLGPVLETLERSALGANTWVVVTGDHGEEFRECGFFGHTSAFTPPQVEVPLLLRGPGIENGVEHAPTSHLDFAPTLLEALGADPALRARWCLGENLLSPLPERERVMAGWNELGLWTDHGILRVPLSPLEFDIEVYDFGWRGLEDDFAILQAERGTLERLGAECNRFLSRNH